MLFETRKAFLRPFTVTGNRAAVPAPPGLLLPSCRRGVSAGFAAYLPAAAVRLVLTSYYVLFSLCTNIPLLKFFSPLGKVPLEFFRKKRYNRKNICRCDGIGRRDGLKIRW